MRSAGALAALLLVPVLASCGRACTTMGAYDGVGFDFSALVSGAPDVPEPWQVTSCVAERCETRTVGPGEGSWTDVREDSLDGTPVRVALRVLDDAGRVLADASAEVVPQRWAVNGEGCEPVVWSAEVALGPDGTLAVRERP